MFGIIEMEYRVSELEANKIKSYCSKNPSKPQKQTKQHTQKLTRIALELIVAADKLMAEEKYGMAKKPLIFAADTLLSIREPNNTVNQLTTVCFDYIAHASEKEEENKTRRLELAEEHPRRKVNAEEVMTVEFCKDKGVFKFKEEDKRAAAPHIKFYVCKLNSILFGYNNMKAENSLFAMVRIYNLPVVLTFLLCCFLFIIQFSPILMFRTNGDSYFGSVENLPIMVASFLFLLPLMLIYFKQSEKHNFSFFQMKLGEEIQAINHDCEVRRLNIKLQLGTVASTSSKEMGYALNIILANKDTNKNEKPPKAKTNWRGF